MQWAEDPDGGGAVESWRLCGSLRALADWSPPLVPTLSLVSRPHAQDIPWDSIRSDILDDMTFTIRTVREAIDCRCTPCAARCPPSAHSGACAIRPAERSEFTPRIFVFGLCRPLLQPHRTYVIKGLTTGARGWVEEIEKSAREATTSSAGLDFWHQDRRIVGHWR